MKYIWKYFNLVKKTSYTNTFIYFYYYAFNIKNIVIFVNPMISLMKLIYFRMLHTTK